MLNLIVSAFLLVAPLPDGGRIEITEGPCHAEVRKHIPHEVAGMFQRGKVVFGGREYKACWALSADRSAVIVFDEDGDSGFVPPSLFGRAVEASN